MLVTSSAYSDPDSIYKRTGIDELNQERVLEQGPREVHKADPEAPAKEHGNRPSRGAVIDKELRQDDELRLQEKSHME